MKKIDARAFKQLLRVTEGEEDGTWVEWLRVAEEGVYFKFPEDNPLLSKAELMAAFVFLDEVDFAAVKRNPLLLAFPCTIPELEDFTENHGLSGCMDAFDLWRWWTASATSRREPIDIQRIEIMVAAASALGLPAMSLPYGGKAKIQRWCMTHHSTLFQTADIFKRAWTNSERPKVLCLAEVDKFRSRT